MSKVQAANWKKSRVHAHHVHSTLQIWILLVLIFFYFPTMFLTDLVHMSLIHFIHIGYALVHGQIMVKGPVDFMLAIVMKQQNKKEW